MTSRRVSPDHDPSNRAKRCVVCGKPQAEAFRPFCSRRCADVDLHRWLSGAYTLPALDDDGADEPAGPEERVSGGSDGRHD